MEGKNLISFPKQKYIITGTIVGRDRYGYGWKYLEVCFQRE